MRTLKEVEDFIRRIEHLHPDRVIYIGSGIANELKPQIEILMKDAIVYDKFREAPAPHDPVGLLFHHLGYTLMESKRLTAYETQVSFFSPPVSIKVPDPKNSIGFVEGLKHEFPTDNPLK